jgi:hypothetical protein
LLALALVDCAHTEDEGVRDNQGDRRIRAGDFVFEP